MSNWCRISLVSLGPELVPSSAEKEKRNWLPVGLAAGVVVVAVVLTVLSLEHANSRGKTTVTPISAPLDPYAQNLALTRVAMSEAGNLAGGKVTYLDGHIANIGARTVTAVTVQVLRSPARSRWRAGLPPDLRWRQVRLGRRLSGDSHPPRRDKIGLCAEFTG